MSDTDSNWRRILNKYGGVSGLQGLTKRSSMSTTWKGVVKDFETIKGGLKWFVGSGVQVPLEEICTQPLRSRLDGKAVRTYWNSGHWIEGLLEEYLPPSVLQLLEGTSLDEGTVRDNAVWTAANYGKFSTKSANLWLLENGETEPDWNRKRIWKFPGLIRSSLTLWFLCGGRLKHTRCSGNVTFYLPHYAQDVAVRLNAQSMQ